MSDDISSINVDNNRNIWLSCNAHTYTSNTVIQSHQTNTNQNFSKFYSYPARSAKNCDVYVGGKVRVAEFMIFLDLQHRGSK